MHPAPLQCSSVEYCPVFSFVAQGGATATLGSGSSVRHRNHERDHFLTFIPYGQIGTLDERQHLVEQQMTARR